jgi:hypothetical protein
MLILKSEDRIRRSSVFMSSTAITTVVKRICYCNGLRPIMRSAVLPSFWSEYRRLSNDVRQSARKAYRL